MEIKSKEIDSVKVATFCPLVRDTRKVLKCPSTVFKFMHVSDNHELLSVAVDCVLPNPEYHTDPKELPETNNERAEACFGILLVVIEDACGLLYDSTSVRLDALDPAVKAIAMLDRIPVPSLELIAVLDIQLVASLAEIPNLVDPDRLVMAN
jgi:hypothetical protein